MMPPLERGPDLKPGMSTAWRQVTADPEVQERQVAEVEKEGSTNLQASRRRERLQQKGFLYMPMSSNQQIAEMEEANKVCQKRMQPTVAVCLVLIWDREQFIRKSLNMNKHKW